MRDYITVSGLSQQITTIFYQQIVVGWLLPTEMYSLTVLNTRLKKKSIERAMLTLKGLRKEESFLVFSYLLVAPGNPWHSLV